MSRWQFCLCGSMTFFLRLMSTWWSFSHASFKSQNFGGLFQDSCFLFLVLTMVMVSTAKSVCLDVQTMPQSNAKIPPPQATFDSRKGKLFSVQWERKKETLVHRLKCENDSLLKSTVIILMKRSSATFLLLQKTICLEFT